MKTTRRSGTIHEHQGALIRVPVWRHMAAAAGKDGLDRQASGLGDAFSEGGRVTWVGLKDRDGVYQILGL
ncbi:hypothetical protein GCM10027395_12770 [Giesbergeria sinuosa]